MELLIFLLDIYVYIILAGVIISWINLSPNNLIVHYIHVLTEPLLEPLRRIIPPLSGLDFTPFVLILIIQFIKKALLA